MSPDPKSDPAGWTVDQLKEYVDRLFAERGIQAENQTRILRDLYDARISAVETEMRTRFDERQVMSDKAEQAQHLRNVAMNEFREQLREQAATLMPRKECETRWEILEKEISEVRSRAERNIYRGEGKSSITGPIWVGIIALIVAVLGGLILTLTGRNAERLNTIERDLPPPAATRPK